MSDSVRGRDVFRVRKPIPLLYCILFFLRIEAGNTDGVKFIQETKDAEGNEHESTILTKKFWNWAWADMKGKLRVISVSDFVADLRTGADAAEPPQVPDDVEGDAEDLVHEDMPTIQVSSPSHLPLLSPPLPVVRTCFACYATRRNSVELTPIYFLSLDLKRAITLPSSAVAGR